MAIIDLITSKLKRKRSNAESRLDARLPFGDEVICSLTYTLILLFSLVTTLANAAIITPTLESRIYTNIGSAWSSVTYENTYSTAPVVVCTYNLPSAAAQPAVVRVRNVTTSGFDVRLQVAIDQNTATASDVYCLISAPGTYTTPIAYTAGTVTTPRIGKAVADTVNITPSDITFTNPVVLGQVTTFDTPGQFATFWSNDCAARGGTPIASAICVGKHAGKNNPADFTETVSYIIAEQDIYYLPDFDVRIERGADTIRGVGNAPPYAYDVDLNYTYGAASQAGEDGGDGGWAVFYGANPLTTEVQLAIDEDTVNGSNRNHTTEEVHYWLIEPLTRNIADIVINEILYREGGSQADEFVEFYVTQSGETRGFVFSSQDGVPQDVYFPEYDAQAGDYIVILMGTGTNQYSNGVYTFYTGSNSNFLANAGDDIVLLKPSTTDVTALVGSSTVPAVPVDYVSWGTGGSIDPVPVSNGGVTVSWDDSNNTQIDGAAAGTSISLSPNADDSDTSLCWEITGSGGASTLTCTGYLPTRDTDPGAAVVSRGDSNTEFPIISLQKTVATIYDPVNLTVNPKSIPGSVEQYTLRGENSGNKAADNNSITLTDIIPVNAKLCVATVAQCQVATFSDGSPSSGLSLNQIQYSNNGGASFTYSPTADAYGADTNVTHIRVTTAGAFAFQTGATTPNFSVDFYIVLE